MPTPESPTRLSHALSVEVRVWMTRRGVSQQEVADALGVSRQAVSARLTGRTQWTVDDLVAVASLLQVAPSALLTSPDG